jgi:hypothetical protein
MRPPTARTPRCSVCRAADAAIITAALTAPIAHAQVSPSFSIDRGSRSILLPARAHHAADILVPEIAGTGEDAGGLGPRVAMPATLLPRQSVAAGGMLDLNALSSNHGSIALSGDDAFRIYFSVQRCDTDLGQCVETQALLNQQPGDVFVSTALFRPVLPGGPHLVFPPLGNACYLNQHQLNMVPTLLPNMLYNDVRPIDNLDAFDFRAFDANGDGILDRAMYYSVSFQTDPDFSSAIFVLPPGWSAASVPAAPQEPAPIYAWRHELLLTSGDDIDALVVFDADNNMQWTPGDAVLLSLTPGSTSLQNMGPYWFGGSRTAADVFLVYLTPAGPVVSRLAMALDLALLGTFMPGGCYGDIDALEVGIETASCYANCDGSTVPPVLNVDDFICFLNQFAAAQSLPPSQQITHYANCDGSTTPPVLNVDDFGCFMNRFAAGCP